MKFKAYFHPNITAKHKNTLEFTKDKAVSLEGDCIIGVNSDFDIMEIKKFINKKISIGEKSIKIIIKNKNKEEVVRAELNPDFDDDNEVVIRKSGFISKRTLGIRADKAAYELDKGLLNPEIDVVIE